MNTLSDELNAAQDAVNRTYNQRFDNVMLACYPEYTYWQELFLDEEAWSVGVTS